MLQPIDVSKLIKARPLDNIEFMQWFKGYFGARDRSPTDYDPIARREASKTGDIKVSVSMLVDPKQGNNTVGDCGYLSVIKSCGPFKVTSCSRKTCLVRYILAPEGTCAVGRRVSSK